jgi:hypothetical protein
MSGRSTSINLSLYAQQHIRRMRGGAQAHLMRASDGAYHVVKFVNNGQHPRILANEFIASRIGFSLGLPIPQVNVIEVSDWLIQNTPELHVELAGHKVPCRSGLQLASRYVADPEAEAVYDYLPESLFNRVMNVEVFAQSLVADKWTGNVDGRQAVFTRSSQYLGYKVWLIDQGYCFNAGEWTFPDLPLHGVYYRNHVYRHVTGWDSFEPALSRAEHADLGDIWQCASQIPHEWYRINCEDRLTGLLNTLYKRRLKIRDLITKFRESSRNPFPNWIDKPLVPVPAAPAASQESRA